MVLGQWFAAIATWKGGEVLTKPLNLKNGVFSAGLFSVVKSEGNYVQKRGGGLRMRKSSKEKH